MILKAKDPYTDYGYPNRKGKRLNAVAAVSVQATRFDDSFKGPNLGVYPRSELIIKRKIYLEKACPSATVSSVNLNFTELASQYPEFRKEFNLLSKLKRSVASFSSLSLRGICLGYNLDGSNPCIHLKFICTDREKLEEAEKLIDSILIE